jgi:hypothetical protein
MDELAYIEHIEALGCDDEVINYDPATGCQIGVEPLAGSEVGLDVTDVIRAIVQCAPFQVSAPLDGALAALEDGSLWDDDAGTQHALEFVHDLIRRHRHGSLAALNHPTTEESDMHNKAEMLAYALALLDASMGWDIDTLAHNIESHFGCTPELADAIADKALESIEFGAA